MSKPKSIVTEYKSCHLPIQFPVLLAGDAMPCITPGTTSASPQAKAPCLPQDEFHFHNCLEIAVCLSQRGRLDFLGESYFYEEGDIIIIPRNIPHRGCSLTDRDSSFSCLYLDPQALFRDILPPTWKNHDLSPYLFPRFCPVFSKSRCPELSYLASAAVRELEEQRADFSLSAKGLLLALYIEIFRLETENINTSGRDREVSASGKAASPEIAGPLAITPALDYIEQNYMQQFTVEQLADLCHWSTTHFRRVFHNIMGVSPLEFVNSTRISKACTLLCSTEDSILNISETVGFHSVSSFNRTFSRIMLMSPREYRRQLQKNELSKPAYDTAPGSSRSSF